MYSQFRESRVSLSRKRNREFYQYRDSGSPPGVHTSLRRPSGESALEPERPLNAFQEQQPESNMAGWRVRGRVPRRARTQSAGSASSHKAWQGTGRIWAPACRRRGAVKTLSNGWPKMMLFKELLPMQREKSYLYNGEIGQIAPSPSDQGQRHQWRHVDTMSHPLRGTRYASNTISYGVSTKWKLAPQILVFCFVFFTTITIYECMGWWKNIKLRIQDNSFLWRGGGGVICEVHISI